MGYRSDVAYKIQFEDKDQWNVFLIEAKSKPETRACFEDEDMINQRNKLQEFYDWVRLAYPEIIKDYGCVKIIEEKANGI